MQPENHIETESVRSVFAFPFLVRLRDHGAWPTLSHISHFLSRIFISHLTPEFFFSSRVKSHFGCPLQASVLFTCNG